MRSSILLALVAPVAVLAYGPRHLAEPDLAALEARASKPATKAPIAPTLDPWYTAPNDFEREAPGTILRIRPAPGNLTTLAANASSAYNILYRTTNSVYKPTWAVTTLFVPKSPASNGKLLSYLMHYDSADLNASPSYDLYSGVDSDISVALGKGYFVNVPDYEGPLASFTAGVLSGHATIDSVRAILSKPCNARIGVPQNAKVALWGYSGGAIAGEWAAELQVQYAPELNISGLAIGGMTPNTTSVLNAVNGGLFAGLTPASILGMTNQHPAVYNRIISLLKPETKAEFLSALNYTLDEAILAYAYKDVGSYFEGGLDAVLNADAVKIIQNDGIMGYHGVPQMPVYAYKAIKDELSVIEDSDVLIERFCGIGANILYERTSIGGHSAGEDNGRESAVAFLDAVLGGTYATTYSTSGCTIRDVAWNVSSSPI